MIFWNPPQTDFEKPSGSRFNSVKRSYVSEVNSCECVCEESKQQKEEDHIPSLNILVLPLQIYGHFFSIKDEERYYTQCKLIFLCSVNLITNGDSCCFRFKFHFNEISPKSSYFIHVHLCLLSYCVPSVTSP